MKPAILIPMFNDVKYVETQIRACMAQTIPCELVFSDQGSTDGTREKVAQIIDGYDGPHEIRLLDCPVRGQRGMKTALAHYDWMWRQTQAPYVAMLSSDDRVGECFMEECLRVHESLHPSCVATCVLYVKEDGTEPNGVTAHRPPGWVDTNFGIEKLVFGSSAHCYEREFLERVHGLDDEVTPDVYLGYLAACDKGFYLIDEPHYQYNRRGRADNAGFTGKYESVMQGQGEAIAREYLHFDLLRLHHRIALVATRLYPDIAPDAHNQLFGQIMQQAGAMIEWRGKIERKESIFEEWQDAA